MITQFNLIIIFILIVFIINSYYLSVKQNIIKLSSFLLRLMLAWVLAKYIAKLAINFNISTINYEYKINGEVINNVTDIVKVFIVQNFPEFTLIINERVTSLYIIESISIMLIRTILIIIFYLIFTIIYKIIILIIKKIHKKKQTVKEEMSKRRGLIFGIIQGFIVIFLISIPFSGVSSLTNEMLRLEDNDVESKEIIFFKEYRNTLSGKIFNVLNVNHKPIDVYFFDEVFAIEVSDSKILLSDEVKVYVDIIEIVEKRNLSKIDKNIVDDLDEDLIVDLINKLKSAKSLNISAPLLIDYFLINYYEIKLGDGIYDVNYYNECTYIGNILILYLNEGDKFDYNNPYNIDPVLISEVLKAFSNLDLLEKLSGDITKNILSNDFIKSYLKKEELDGINLENVNYQSELKIISDIFSKIFEIDNKFDENTIEEISLLIASSNLLMDNDEIILEYIIQNLLYEYKDEIKRLALEENDIRSLLIIARAYIDNGALDQYFKFSKLYDEATINTLIEAITSSDLLLNNIGTIIKLLLKASKFEIDFPVLIPEDIDFKGEEGKRELKELLRLFQIFNYGINQKNLEENLDEICSIVEKSSVIKANINNFINWAINKYNTYDIDIYVLDMDFNTAEGDVEVKKLIKILRMLVGKKIIDKDITAILSLTKEDIDTVFSSRLIEEASIHLLFDLGKKVDIPLVVNYEVNDPAWYKSARNDGELRNFVYAIKIIFKDVEKIEDIKFTPELILSIDDGTIDTNGDGVVNDRDENELKEIMKSKILSDSIIKFIYDYYKDLNEK